MTGYLGARHARAMRSCRQSTEGAALAFWVRERRCAKTGGQLTAGGVLSRLEGDAYRLGSPGLNRIANPYPMLRRLAEDLGVRYVDRAGREHILYTWAELRVIERRFARAVSSGRIRLRSHPTGSFDNGWSLRDRDVGTSHPIDGSDNGRTPQDEEELIRQLKLEFGVEKR